MAPPWQGMKQMEKDFQQNEELITSVKNYLAESEYNYISITDSMARGQMFVNIAGQSYAKIDNEEIIDAIRQLKKHGYSSISKRANVISFVRWTGFDVSKGVAYSVDGVEQNYGIDPKIHPYGSPEMPVAITFLTKLEPMSEDGWYYYEADYNKWRVNNRH